MLRPCIPSDRHPCDRVLLALGSRHLYSLRSQIKRHYQEAEGWDIEIGPVFTLLFSAIYINYCLNPITLSEKATLISINLAQTPQKANLRK